MSGAATDTAGACYARRAGKTDSSLDGASSPRSVSRSMLSIAAWMLPSALLRAAAPTSRPIRTRRSHSPLDGNNHIGCMSSARAINRRSRRDTVGATTPVKTAAREPTSCGDGPYFRSSSLAAGPPGSRRSAVTLSVSFASAACPPLLRIPPGLVTRCKRERRILASRGPALRVAFRV